VALNVFFPQRLYIQAGQDIHTGGFMGARVELVAGNDVVLSGGLVALIRVNAGRDFQVGSFTNFGALLANAGRDILLPNTPTTMTWVGGPGGTLTLRDPASLGTVASIRGLVLSAGRDVVAPQPVHVSDGIDTTALPVTLSAGRNLTLGQLETIGDVSLSAATGNVTVTFPLGAPVPPAPGLWNPANLGVNSLSVSAPGNGAVISLQGARSVGNVALIAPNGGTVNSAFAVTSSAGSVTVIAPTQNISATPIAPVARLILPGIVSPAIAPGPLRAGPDGPVIPAAPAPGGPGLPEILVSAPGAIDAGAVAAPGQGGSGSGDAAAQAANAARASTASTADNDGTLPVADGATATSGQAIVLYSGGRGVAQSADLGRSGNYGAARAPQGNDDDDKRKRRAVQKKP